MIEEQSRTSEDRFRKIFDHSNDAIFLIDPVADEILDVNARACSMLGYSREELRSLPISLIHPQEMPKLRAFAESVFKEGQGWTNELTCLTHAGATLSAEISASVFDLDGRPCMVAMIRDVTDLEHLRQQNDYLNEEIRSDFCVGSICGSSPAILKIREQIEIVAPTDANVLVTGESGTGKELVARAIHDQSPRSREPMVRVNCASIPPSLFESEFFGHVKGAFTGAVKDRVGRFELAHGGSIFLDEISEIPRDLQSKLLRVLQESELERVGEARTRRVDVRIIAATNHELLAQVAEGRFREDLYYRLSVFPIHIPPLRDRSEDVGPLAKHFVQKIAQRQGIPEPRLTKAEVDVLQSYSWPGNVRELQNLMERGVILARGGRLQLDFAGGPASAPPALPARLSPAADMTLDDVRELERDVIIRALEDSDWKIRGENGAANRLRLKPTTLASRMKRMGISRLP